MENRLRELEEKLKKSEYQRQKLKGNLVRSCLASERQKERTTLWYVPSCSAKV